MGTLPDDIIRPEGVTVLGDLDESRDSPRRLRRLAVLLGGADPTQAAGYVARLRHWAAVHAPSGTLTGYSPRTLARAAGWRGEPTVLLAALAGAGLLVRRPGGAWLRVRPDLLSTTRQPGGDSQPLPASECASVRLPISARQQGAARLHAHALWEAALHELRGMVNEANFAAFLRGTIGLYQSGGWLTVGVPSAYVQEVLGRRFRTAIDRALYDVTGLPLHARLLELPPEPPRSA